MIHEGSIHRLLPCEYVIIPKIMILVTHGAVGAAIGQALKTHPILAIIAAFLSHFCLDAIPHWDYSLRSSKEDPNNQLNNDIIIGKDFYIDLVKIGCDVLAGLIIALLIARPTTFYEFLFAMATALAAMVPDFLQFFYFKWRHEPLVSLQKFHTWIHAKIKLKDRPIFGASFQAGVILLAFFISRMY